MHLEHFPRIGNSPASLPVPERPRNAHGIQGLQLIARLFSYQGRDVAWRQSSPIRQERW